MAIVIFLLFVGLLLVISFYLSSKARSASGYFVAGGTIHWAVNGIALTGGYLSAASFLGICGMIAFHGFDGYLYSIGFLSGWVVALFVVAEPLRRLGKYTLADALGARFESKGIHLAAGISTLVISLCYLVPQMVGAGVLMEPLVGIPHHWGVIIVGTIVIIIVASAGMASTTYVQFLKAGLLILFCGVIVVATCARGVNTSPASRNIRGEIAPDYNWGVIQTLDEGADALVAAIGDAGYHYERTVDAESGTSANTWVLLSRLEPLVPEPNGSFAFRLRGRTVQIKDEKGLLAGPLSQLGNAQQQFTLVDGVECVLRDGIPYARIESWWKRELLPNGGAALREAQHLSKSGTGPTMINGIGPREGNDLVAMGRIARLPEGESTGPTGPFRFLSVIADKDTLVQLPRTSTIQDGNAEVTLHYHGTVTGNELLRPGGYFDLSAPGPWPRLDFISLMMALFFGTAALPHVLIRYYTVSDSTAARRSTIVAIAAIGLFYILTLYLGLGAIVNGVLNPLNSNMAAPLLARSFGETLFAVVSSIAFATVLGTVSGLIVAASGAVANDLADRSFGLGKSDRAKVFLAKSSAVVVGIAAIVLGIVLRGMNVGFLVGWAFAVAASANFPSILGVLFWKQTTSQGIIASIFTGIVSSVAIILLGPDMFEVYGRQRADALIPLSQPGLISIPLSFLILVVVSIFTYRCRHASDLTQG